MNKKFVYFFLFLITPFLACANQSKDALNYHSIENAIFSTKFGLLTMVDDNGKTDSNVVDIKINNKIVFSSRNLKNGWGNNENIMHPLYDDGIQLSKDFKPGIHPFPIDRMILMIGPDGNCFNQAIIVDVTGDAPYVTDQFGYNPEGKDCLKFVKARWGKKESYIYLDGPLKYVYYTGGKVIGPLE